jgi:LytR cell envelope-related transcriptional attenuator
VAAPAGDGGVLELARHLLIAGLAALVACRGTERRTAFGVPGDHGPRLQLEVLNTTGRQGLARAGVRVLRQAGLDVVYFGTAPGEALDSTRIVVRRGSAAVGERVRRALGVGKVVVQRDSTLLLDASVLLGRDFAPPPDFHP